MSTRWGSKIFLLISMLQTMQPNRASPWSVSELASGGFGVIFRGCHLGVSHVFCLLQCPATPMLILRGATWLASCNPFWTESNPGQETQPWALNTSDRNNVAKSPHEKLPGRVFTAAQLAWEWLSTCSTQYFATEPQTLSCAPAGLWDTCLS